MWRSDIPGLSPGGGVVWSGPAAMVLGRVSELLCCWLLGEIHPELDHAHPHPSESLETRPRRRLRLETSSYMPAEHATNQISQQGDS